MGCVEGSSLIMVLVVMVLAVAAMIIISHHVQL